MEIPIALLKRGRQSYDEPKIFTGRTLKLLLPVPEPEEVRDMRLRANLSQAQACAIVGIKEVMTWSNCERRRLNKNPIARMDPIKWAYFLMETGQHPGFVLLPRNGVEFPKSTNAQRRRGASPPEIDISFTVEHFQRRQWEPINGYPFSTMAGACAAVNAIDRYAKLGSRVRIRRYLDGEPEKVISNTTPSQVKQRFSLRQVPPLRRHPSKPATPSCARAGWRR